MFELPEIKHSQHVIWTSLDSRGDRPMLTVVERYEGVQTYFRRGYRVSLLDWRTGDDVTEPVCTASPGIAAWAVWNFTDNGEGEGFYPNLLELEEV